MPAAVLVRVITYLLQTRSIAAYARALALPVKILGQVTVLHVSTLMLRQRLLESVCVWTGTMGLRILVLSARVLVRHAVGLEGVAVCCVSIMLRRMGAEHVCATLGIGLIRMLATVVLVMSHAKPVTAHLIAYPAILMLVSVPPPVSATPTTFLILTQVTALSAITLV